MTPENDKMLCDKYPKIFARRHMPMDQTCMCWGIEPSEGWLKLIDDLCAKLQAIADIAGVQTIAEQVKEKYAGLRFYYDIDDTLARQRSAKSQDGIPGFSPLDDELLPWHDIIDDVVNHACDMSFSTCEECGEHGEEVKRGSWWMTRCEKHLQPGDKVRWIEMITQEEKKRRRKAEEEAWQKEQKAFQEKVLTGDGGEPSADIPGDAFTGGTLAADEQIAPDEFCKDVMESFKQYQAGHIDADIDGPPPEDKP